MNSLGLFVLLIHLYNLCLFGHFKKVLALHRELKIYGDSLVHVDKETSEREMAYLQAQLELNEQGHLEILAPQTLATIDQLIAEHPKWGAGKVAIALRDLGIFAGVGAIHLYLWEKK